ncbi:CDK5 regulatory subunit-associated protein 2 isoform X2 [Bombina bombina]|uniref:CDK5 regulatory subunit-associated protein 2 isoform X2 n=1 Tax=Bombina bombina TaxID=8345 RepID=UPI00235B2DE4|nr:CDK5 regulatory subunit-associated protein 2 isoform X2 [Bombina bombina]
MDSIRGEDMTLPLDFNNSAQISMLFDAAEGGPQDHFTGSSGFGSYINNRLSVNRAHTMKDFEMQIADLKKENFNLKLRIYFLEEQVQQKCDSSSEELYRMNIELKVEVESLKHDLQEKQNLLVKASKAVESLAGDSGSKIQRLKEESLKQLQEVENLLNQKILLLQKEVNVANEEVEKIGALLDQERLKRIDANEKLSSVEELHVKDIAELEERDGIIQQLNITLLNKEALINELEKHLTSGAPCDNSTDMSSKPNEHLFKNDITEEDYKLMLQEKETEIALHKKNALKRDKTIQGLTVALKTKDKENDELLIEIENLNVGLAKARESAHKAQLQNFKGVEDYHGILIEKEKLLTKQHESLMEKERENRTLQATLKEKDTALNDLHQDREQLKKDLEEAQQQKSSNDKTINDLKNQLEKLNNEMREKENSVQLHYNIIISEHSQKVLDQEQVIKQLTDDLNQKSEESQESKEKLEKYRHCVSDSIDRKEELEYLKKELDSKEEFITKLNLAIQESELETKQLVKKCKNLQQSKDDFEKKAAYQIKERDFIITELQQLLKSKEHEGEKEPEYRQLFAALKAEQEMYSQLIKSAKGAESLQKELDTITLLRRRLEADIQEYQELQKMLKQQIMAAKWRESDTFSFLGDQTSYFSICLENIDQHADHLSVEELRGKVAELMLLIKEMQSNEVVNKDPEYSCNVLNKETQTGSSDDWGFKELGGFKQVVESQQSGTLLELQVSPNKEPVSHDNASDIQTNITKVLSPVRSLITEGNHKCEDLDMSGEEVQKHINPISSHDDLISGIKPLTGKQMENVTESEDFSINCDDINIENLKNIIIQLRKELKYLKQNSLLDTKQDICFEDNPDAPLNISKLKISDFHNLNTEDTEMAQERAKTGRVIDTMKSGLNSMNDGRNNMQRIKEETRMTKSAKKSRIPILIKPASYSKPDGETPGMFCAVRDCIKLQKELESCQIDDHRLYEQSLHSQTETESLRENKPVLKGNGTLDNLQNSQDGDKHVAEPFSDEDNADPFSQFSLNNPELRYTEQSESRLQEQLELSQLQNHLMMEKLQRAEIEIEKLKANEILLKDMSTLIYLNDSHKEREPFNQSFDADKTITNVSDCKEMQDVNEDNEKETCDGDIHLKNNKDHKNGLNKPRDHPNNTKILQQPCESENQTEANELNETHSEISLFADPSLARYNLLVQSQARELSAQRHQIKESHSLSVMCCRNFINVLKAFEELLQASNVDFYVAEGFREQLNQSITWIQKLEYKLGNGDLDTDADINENLPVHRYSAETQREHLYERCQFKETAPMSPSHHIRSEVEISEFIYVGTSYHNQQNVNPKPPELSQNLLIEHLDEIRKLRQRLEESIKTNDMLRKQLERQITEAEQGSGYSVNKGEQYSELVSEIYHLRKQNETFQFLLAKESRDKENSELRDALSQKNLLIEHLTHDCEHMKRDNEKMQQIIADNEREIGRLCQELSSNHKQLARQQSELNLQQHQIVEQDQLLRALRIELKVYEHFNEKVHKKPEVKVSQKGVGDCKTTQQGNDHTSCPDLSELLDEIQCLRVQLERSIKVSHALHEKLKEQLSRDAEGKEFINYYPKEDFNNHTERNQGAHHEEETYSNHSAESSSYTPSRLVPGHRMWADKHGRHILGLVEDFIALRKQMLEGGAILQDLEAYFDNKIPNDLGNIFAEKIGRARHSLEEANRLTKLLWRVSLPIKTLHANSINQDEKLKMEIIRLRKK